MMALFKKSYIPPPFDEREMLRYASCREASEEVLALLRECCEQAAPLLTYRVCSRKMPLTVLDDACRLGEILVPSKKLARHLEGCDGAVLFAATIGLPFDRLLARQSRFSPARALLLQALGAERIEALCDAFCAELAVQQKQEGYLTRSRFSPGYGDLPLGFQATLFSLLDCERAIGLTLTGSGIMSPTKSVTAIVGLARN